MADRLFLNMKSTLCVPQNGHCQKDKIKQTVSAYIVHAMSKMGTLKLVSVA